MSQSRNSKILTGAGHVESLIQEIRLIQGGVNGIKMNYENLIIGIVSDLLCIACIGGAAYTMDKPINTPFDYFWIGFLIVCVFNTTRAD